MEYSICSLLQATSEKSIQRSLEPLNLLNLSDVAPIGLITCTQFGCDLFHPLKKYLALEFSITINYYSKARNIGVFLHLSFIGMFFFLFVKWRKVVTPLSIVKS